VDLQGGKTCAASPTRMVFPSDHLLQLLAWKLKGLDRRTWMQSSGTGFLESRAFPRPAIAMGNKVSACIRILRSRMGQVWCTNPDSTFSGCHLPWIFIFLDQHVHRMLVVLDWIRIENVLERRNRKLRRASSLVNGELLSRAQTSRMKPFPVPGYQ
jgi:hypothetical protein